MFDYFICRINSKRKFDIEIRKVKKTEESQSYNWNNYEIRNEKKIEFYIYENLEEYFKSLSRNILKELEKYFNYKIMKPMGGNRY